MMLFGIIVSLLITLVVALCYILVISFTVWMMIDAGKQDRFWWLVCIIGLPIIGPAAYYFTEKKHEYAKVPPHHVHTSETEEQHEQAPKKRAPRKPKIQSVVAETTPMTVENVETPKVESFQQIEENTSTDKKPE